jgi:hypothetical protein
MLRNTSHLVSQVVQLGQQVQTLTEQVARAEQSALTVQQQSTKAVPLLQRCRMAIASCPSCDARGALTADLDTFLAGTSCKPGPAQHTAPKTTTNSKLPNSDEAGSETDPASPDLSRTYQVRSSPSQAHCFAALVIQLPADNYRDMVVLHSQCVLLHGSVAGIAESHV